MQSNTNSYKKDNTKVTYSKNKEEVYRWWENLEDGFVNTHYYQHQDLEFPFNINQESYQEQIIDKVLANVLF